MTGRLLALLGVVTLGHTVYAATTCPVLVQSRTTSTLADPITQIVSPSSSSDEESDTTSSDIIPDSGSDFMDAGGSHANQTPDVGSIASNSSHTNSTSTSDGDKTSTRDTTPAAGRNESMKSTGDSSPSTTTTGPPTPASTPETPPATTETSTTTTKPSTSTETTATVKTPEITTLSPVTPTPSTTPSTSPTPSPTPSTPPSSESVTPTTENTASVSLNVRKLQAITTATNAITAPTTGTTGTTGTTATTATNSTTATTPTAPTTGTAPVTGPTTPTTGTTSTADKTATSGATANTTTTSSNATDSVDSVSTSSGTLACDSTFYSQWDKLGLKCGGFGIDVASAVAASSCVIYSGSVGSTSGSTCVSICSFPACTNNVWVYGAENGISSPVYNGLSIQSFLPSGVLAALEESSSSVSSFLSNSTMSASEQCAYSSESSFSSCTCSATLVDISSTGTLADAAKKELRQQDEAYGIITKDNTTTAGTVVAATSKSVAGVTVAVTGIAAIASTAVGGVNAAGASFAAAGSSMAITTVEICQFGVLINQLQLDGKSSALAQFGIAMAPSAFTFLPFGKLKKPDSKKNSHNSSPGTSSRRLSTKNSTDTTQLNGIEKYARQLNINEDMLFVVTLAGVFCIMASVVGLFGLGYLISGIMMPRDEYLNKFFDKMIGLEVLVAILSQYTIGVTATFQIYYSTKYESITDPKCLLAIAAIIFLAAGILVYGYFVIKKHEADIADVGTVQHLKKPVNMRYGPLYEEYKFKNRYFFAAKMMLALTTGVITGCASMSGKVQVALILAINVIFFFYLEIQSPHHSKFVQTTTSFVSVMKIAVLVLTFFLVTAASSDGFPTSLQNGISVAIVGLNLFVLALLMIRSLYTFWQKMKLQRNANYDQEEQTTHEYFKDETPAGRKDRAPSHPQAYAGQQQVLQSQYPNVNNNNNGINYQNGDATNHYSTERRNDVVEL